MKSEFDHSTSTSRDHTPALNAREAKATVDTWLDSLFRETDTGCRHDSSRSNSAGRTRWRSLRVYGRFVLPISARIVADQSRSSAP